MSETIDFSDESMTRLMGEFPGLQRHDIAAAMVRHGTRLDAVTAELKRLQAQRSQELLRIINQRPGR